jgi:putative membrane-bound dehydrogenase-like protein
MQFRGVVFSMWLSFTAWAGSVGAEEPVAKPNDLPRVPPTERGDVLKTFRIRPGLPLELVAAEPLVVDPIALSFDEDGRLFVVEMRDYSERRPERLGRIRRLEDQDGDGRFDTSTVYVEDLPWPTAVICYDGGVFVGAAPDILFCKDTDGDGEADVRQVVFTGFASDYAPYATNKLNVQALLNSFTWGLDNRIHGAASLSGGQVVAVKHPERPPLELRGRDFAFDPRTLTIQTEPGGGQYGLSFDNSGRKFICHNSDHIQTIMFDDRYAARNPAFVAPSPKVSIAVDGPSAEVFRLSPDEPWRVIRTKWRVSGLVSGPIEGGGRASGYFTSATGITIYRGDALPKDFVGDAFIADCGSNLLHRKKLRADGVGLKAERPAEEQRVEFLASTDNWFRPVQMANAPDGALYIADMYREIIEHPWSLPPGIKQFLDLNSGQDRGRIYRVVTEGFKQPKLPRLSKASTAELVALLEQPNGWQRDTAARLLYERQDRSAVPALEKLARQSRSALGRMHALHALNGLEALTPAHLSRALSDTDAVVREHAVRLCEKFVRGSELQAVLAERLLVLADDPDARVRYQLAFTLGEFKHPQSSAALARIVRRDHADSWIQAAVLTSLHDGAREVFTALVAEPAFSGSDTGLGFLRQLMTVIGAQNRSADLAQVIAYLSERAAPALAFSLAGALAEGLQRAGSSLTRADAQGKLKGLSDRALDLAKTEATPEPLRLAAIRWLGGTSFDHGGSLLLALIAPDHPLPVRAAALAAVARFNRSEVTDALLEHWDTYTPRLRDEAVAALLSRPDRASALLTAVEQSRVPRSALSSAQIDFLRNHGNAELRQRAIAFYATPPAGQRQEIVQASLPALRLQGDITRGKAIYLERCASCHRLAGQGYALGPDLETVRNADREKTLINILDPNREVAPNYVSFLVETQSDESWLGLIVNETPASLTLRRANGEETVIARSAAVKIQSQGLSIMPEGLEEGLTPQAMADLLEYIVSASP